MGGKVECQDNVYGGSDFILYVPFEYTLEQPVEDRGSYQSLLSEPYELDILLVEDNKLNLKLLERYIARLTSNFRIAHDGQEGLKAITERMPNIIITDINMPIMNGIDMLEQCKSLPKFNKTLIIVTSADRIDNIDVHCLKNP
jgi:CheY-like chemotaxis protein